MAQNPHYRGNERPSLISRQGKKVSEYNNPHHRGNERPSLISGQGKKVSEYNQDILHSHTAAHTTQGRATLITLIRTLIVLIHL